MYVALKPCNKRDSGLREAEELILVEVSPVKNSDVILREPHVLQRAVFMPVRVRDEKMVGALERTVEPCVDFDSAFCASELRPFALPHVKRDRRRVDELQRFLFFPGFPAAEKFVMPKKMKVKLLEHLARSELIGMGQIRPCDSRFYSCMV